MYKVCKDRSSKVDTFDNSSQQQGKRHLLSKSIKVFFNLHGGSGRVGGVG